MAPARSPALVLELAQRPGQLETQSTSLLDQRFAFVNVLGIDCTGESAFVPANLLLRRRLATFREVGIHCLLQGNTHVLAGIDARCAKTSNLSHNARGARVALF